MPQNLDSEYVNAKFLNFSNPRKVMTRRENFGVWQLPLFNILVSEGLDWHACLSWPGGRRWLNTRVHLKICTRCWLMMREWAYRCHLERLETSLGNESYVRLKDVAGVGGSSEMGLRCHLERTMLRNEPYARLCRYSWKCKGAQGWA